MNRRLTFADFGTVKALAENYDVECKLAAGRDGRGQFPTAALESYSAFANTEGGWIVLGVNETPSGMVVNGIEDIARVQKQLFDALNNRQQVSSNILTNADVEVVEQDDKTLLVIRVPTATREQRPVYVGENPFGGTYLRNFEGDYRVDDSTVKRMLAEVAIDARDSESLKGFGFDDLDAESFAQFRNLFKSSSPDHPFLAGSDSELLRSLGGSRRNRDSGDNELTVAGLLMFGTLVNIRERFPHYNLDYQEHHRDVDRWVERVTTDGRWAGNLFQFYRKVLVKLTSNLEIPFELDDQLQRIDTTHVHTAVREALVNTLVHADYDATTPIRIVKQETSFEFRNPGRLRLPKQQVFEGGMSDCRNPAIQTMFQMIGAGEKAGSGFPTILQAWQKKHWRYPRLEQNIEAECTTLTLPFTSLLPADAVAGIREALGNDFDELDHDARVVVVTAWMEDHVTHERLMQVLDIHSRDLTLLLEKLVRHELLERLGTGRGCYYQLSHPVSPLGEPHDTHNEQSLQHNEQSLQHNEQSLQHNEQSLQHNEQSLQHNEQSLQHNEQSLQHNEQSLQHNEQSLQHNEQSLQHNEQNYSNQDDRGREERLAEIATPIREAKRVSRDKMEQILIELCSVCPLSLNELAALVGRNAAGLSQRYLTTLAREGRLLMRYPERISHPQQQYIAPEDVTHTDEDSHE